MLRFFLANFLIYNIVNKNKYNILSETQTYKNEKSKQETKNSKRKICGVNHHQAHQPIKH
jgi:hypothetical protein